jgi:hypothetical protein
MSRGPGHIQRVILALTEGDPHGDGAWTLSQICEQAYPGINRPEKKHRVAVARALRKMTLPETWEVRRMEGHGEEYCLHNACSLTSVARMDWLAECKQCDQRGHPRPNDDIAEFMRRRAWWYEPSTERYNAYARVQRAIRWRDGSEVERLEIQIEDTERRVELLQGAEIAEREAARLPELRARLAELKAYANVV